MKHRISLSSMKQFAAKGSTRICEILVLKKKKKKRTLPNGAKLLNTDVSIPVTFSRCHAQHTELNVIFSFCIFLKAKEIVFSGVNSPPALFAILFCKFLHWRMFSLWLDLCGKFPKPGENRLTSRDCDGILWSPWDEPALPGLKINNFEWYD